MLWVLGSSSGIPGQTPNLEQGRVINGGGACKF